MTDSQCMGRLLASATHDMRNVLAVIRESAGLAQDMVQLAAGADKPADPRVIKALKEAQQQILRGAALAECMEYLAQVSHSENENAPCDLARVASTFCLMAARRARAVQMVLESADSEEPVWSAVPALAVLRALLDIFDRRSPEQGGRHHHRSLRRRQSRHGPGGPDGQPPAQRPAPARLAGPADALARSGTALFPLHFRLRE